MSENRCGNCRWWEWDEVKRGRIAHRQGECHNYSAWNRVSGGYGRLKPRADFGCPYHKPKKEVK